MDKIKWANCPIFLWWTCNFRFWLGSPDYRSEIAGSATLDRLIPKLLPQLPELPRRSNSWILPDIARPEVKSYLCTRNCRFGGRRWHPIADDDWRQKLQIRWGPEITGSETSYSGNPNLQVWWHCRTGKRWVPKFLARRWRLQSIAGYPVWCH